MVEKTLDWPDFSVVVCEEKDIIESKRIQREAHTFHLGTEVFWRNPKIFKGFGNI